MAASEFIDYYEILEISPNANSGTIERMFRYVAQRYHPDKVVESITSIVDVDSGLLACGILTEKEPFRTRLGFRCGRGNQAW